MKILWNIVIVLSGLTELLAATTLIGGPEGVTAAGSGNMWSMHYGFAALAIASLSVWIWPRRHVADAVVVALGVLITFHTGLLISLTLAGDQPVGMVLHGLLAVLSAVVFIRRDALYAQGD